MIELYTSSPALMATLPWLNGYGKAYSISSTSYSVPPEATVAMLGDTSVKHESAQVISTSSPMSNAPKLAHCDKSNCGIKTSTRTIPMEVHGFAG